MKNLFLKILDLYIFIKLRLIVINFVLVKKYNYNLFDRFKSLVTKIFFLLSILIATKRSLFFAAVGWYFVLFTFLLFKFHRVSFINFQFLDFKMSSPIFLLLLIWLSYFIINIFISKIVIKNKFLSLLINLLTIYFAAKFGVAFFFETKTILNNSLFNIII